MHFVCRKFLREWILVFKRLDFCQTATIYCSGGKQLSKQASLATPLATGTAILHTEKWRTKQKTAEQRQWKKNEVFFCLFLFVLII